MPTFPLLKMNNLQKYIEELINDPEIYLLDVFDNRSDGSLRIVIDAEKPISISMTAEITKALRDSEEIQSYFIDGCRIEVSSPGMSAGLEHSFQYRKNIGRKLKLIINSGEKQKSLKAVLKDVEKDSIIVQLNDKIKQIDFADIVKAKVMVSFR